LKRHRKSTSGYLLGDKATLSCFVWIGVALQLSVFRLLFVIPLQIKYDAHREARAKPVLPLVENDLLRSRLLDNYTRNTELPMPILQPATTNGFLHNYEPVMPNGRPMNGKEQI
jgi:hypothetical protein